VTGSVATGPTSPARLAHLPALDGLRAVAVVLVIAYHLDAGWLPGGFLGVDLFFVISGFLITTLLLRERAATGRIGLRDFWVRRFRRLVPLLVVVVAATVAATRAWGVPEQWSSVRADALGALAYVANWRFVLADQSYFESLLGPSPLLHTWSLGVEEQWYLVWPLAMAGLGALAVSSRGRRAVLAALGLGIAASATSMVVLFDASDPSRAYYGTDSRAQHLLVGAALAWLLHLRPGLVDAASRRRWRPAAPVALTVLVVVAATTPADAAWLYRGGLLALSLVAAVVVWAVTVPVERSSLGWLAAPPLVWLGRRSYGLYLWHWPVVVFVGAPIGLEWTGAPLLVTRLAAVLALTELGHRLVEVPARRPGPGVARPVLGWTAGALATLLVATVVLVPPTGREPLTATVVRPDVAGSGAGAGSSPAAPPSTAAATTVPPPAADPARDPLPAPAARAEPEPGAAARPPAEDGAIGAGAAAAAPTPRRPEPRTVLILGDSTALVLVLEIRDLDHQGWDVQSFSRLGCAITDGDTIDAGASRPTGHDPECRDWRTDWRTAVDDVQPDAVVVMVGAWEVLDHVVDGETLRFPAPAWSAHVRLAVRTATRIAGASGAPVALTSLPCMRQTPGSLVSADARNDPARVDAFNAIVREEVERRPDTHLLDLASLLCPAGEPRRVDGDDARYDGVHVSPAGAAVVWDWMVSELDRLVPASVAR
jgi:peptidoglycan/LPS O-acetylase OafA/YrhL